MAVRTVLASQGCGSHAPADPMGRVGAACLSEATALEELCVERTPPQPSPASRGGSKEKAGRSPLFRYTCDVARQLLRRRALAFLHGLHRQADAALLVDFQHLDLHHVAFLELVADLLDALVGDL